ncbi:MAG: hypothetical protein ACLR4W_14540 [Oscillospiraceae bacterium]
MKQALTDKLRLGFGVTPEEADDAQVMRAAALVLRDVMTERGVESRMATRREESGRCITFPWNSCWAAAWKRTPTTSV